MNPPNLKVLIVDDNEHVRYQLRGILSPFHCECFEADTAEDALTMIKEHAFDVLFLDMRLPYGVTGIDVFLEAKDIRRDDLGKVIILSGWLEDETRTAAISLGAHAWLDKAPLDPDKILKAFSSAISEFGGEAA